MDKRWLSNRRKSPTSGFSEVCFLGVLEMTSPLDRNKLRKQIVSVKSTRSGTPPSFVFPFPPEAPIQSAALALPAPLLWEAPSAARPAQLWEIGAFCRVSWRAGSVLRRERSSESATNSALFMCSSHVALCVM